MKKISAQAFGLTKPAFKPMIVHYCPLPHCVYFIVIDDSGEIMQTGRAVKSCKGAISSYVKLYKEICTPS